MRQKRFALQSGLRFAERLLEIKLINSGRTDTPRGKGLKDWRELCDSQRWETGVV